MNDCDRPPDFGPAQWGYPAPINLGAEGDVGFPALKGDEVEAVILQTNLRALNGQVIAVALNETEASYDTSLADGDSAARFGRLRWTVGQRRQVGDFDLKAGGSIFALACDSVTISVVNTDNTPVRRRYNASVSLSLSAPNLRAPTRSFANVLPPGAAVGPFDVPRHAVSVFLTADIANGPPVVLTVTDTKAATTAVLADVSSSVTPFLPLPQGSRRWGIVNPGFSFVSATAVFELGF